MIDEKALPQSQNHNENQENQEKRDNGFIDFYYHKVYITEPPRINSSLINPNMLVQYLGLPKTRNVGDQLETIMLGLLLFHEKGSITIPSAEVLQECKRGGFTTEEMNKIVERLFFHQEQEPIGLGELFFSHYRNHYDFIQGLAYLGELLKKDGFTGESEKTELTYKDDLKYVLAFIAYANELVAYTFDKNHDNPMYHKELPHDDIVHTVQDIIERVVQFRKEYEHDNATIPFGHVGGLKTNVARFTYKYHLPAFYDTKDEELTEAERVEKQQELMLYHRDTQRDIRDFMRIYKGFYSVVYNPLLNKLFVWDYSNYHMKDL